MPHHVITRGDGSKPIEQGQATWTEYFVALRRLAANPSFQPIHQAALYKHEEDLAVMAIPWDCATCRRWSEKNI